MSIVEFRGGPITHRYLERKPKWELERMYLDNQRRGFGGLLIAEDFKHMRKFQIVNEVMSQVRRMPA